MIQDAHIDQGQAALEGLREQLVGTHVAGRGVVVVTHHLAALGAADEVVLLQPMGDGPATVWDRGTHEDLVGRVDPSRSRSMVAGDDRYSDQLFLDFYFPGAPEWVDLQYHGTHVAATVGNAAEVDDELRHLLSLYGN